MLLDASKAFDRVEYLKLFKLLLKKGLCSVVARVLASLYMKQSVKVKWGSSISRQISVSNGVNKVELYLLFYLCHTSMSYLYV